MIQQNIVRTLASIGIKVGLRRSHRHTVDLPCTFSFAGDESQGRITNLSVEGAFVEVSETCPPEGAQVQILLKIAGQALWLDAMVRHSGWYLLRKRTFYAFGVEFSEITPEISAAIETCLSGSPVQEEEKLRLASPIKPPKS